MAEHPESGGLKGADAAGRPGLFGATVLVVIGMDTFIVQPGFVQGLVESSGFDERQSGLIASAEMFGIAATTVLLMWLASRVNWRTAMRVSLAVNLLGNVLSLAATSATAFATTRFAVGLSSGVLISIGYAAVGLTAKPDRNFGLLITWVLVYGAIGLLAMPAALAATGMHGVLGFFGLAAVAGLPMVERIPDRAPANHADRTAAIPHSAPLRLLLLAAVLLYFLGQGCLWAYLSLIGVANGGTDQQVAAALMAAQFLGIAGALTAATAGTRLRYLTSMLAGIIGGTLPICAFLAGGGAWVFGVAVGVFNYGANFVTPLLMAVVSKEDPSGKLITYAVALQMLGLAIGPALGALAVRPGDYTVAIYLSIALFLACLALIVPPVNALGRRHFESNEGAVGT